MWGGSELVQIIIAERLIEVVLALVPGWLVVRRLRRLNQRNRWMGKTLAGAAVLLIYAAFVLGCALYAPAALRGVAAITLIVIGVFLWRARSGYGKGRGLPPGSLAPTSNALITDQGFYLKQSAKHGPIFKMSPGLLRPYACVVGHALALDFLKTPLCQHH